MNPKIKIALLSAAILTGLGVLGQRELQRRRIQAAQASLRERLLAAAE
jgi:hypothetical protein